VTFDTPTQPRSLAVNGAAPDDVLDHYFSPPDKVCMARGEGIWLYDEDGNRFMDCESGTFNLVLGYSHPEIVATIREQAGSLIHVTSRFQTRPLNELVGRLVDVSPPNLSKVHLKSASGSDANEGAIKVAQHVTGKNEVITLFRSHLGQTMGMLGASGIAFRRALFPFQSSGTIHVPDPYCFRCFYKQHPDTCGRLCVERINDFIDWASSDRVAALMVEPISGNGGNIVPPPGYFEALKVLCEERGIVLIFDEIQTGFGRTGQMFAADYFGVAPHMLTFGKGLGGSGMPIAGILMEERFVGLEGHHINATFGANVLSVAVACKTIEIVSRPGFLENVRSVGAYVMDRLLDIATKVPYLADVRGAGLMLGCEIVDAGGKPNAALTNRIADVGMEHGLLLRTSMYGRGNVVKVRPSLILTPEEAQLMCDKLEQVFLAVA
jgi:4-aminobutyrate aminotransferase-like enzyme